MIVSDINIDNYFPSEELFKFDSSDENNFKYHKKINLDLFFHCYKLPKKLNFKQIKITYIYY